MIILTHTSVDQLGVSWPNFQVGSGSAPHVSHHLWTGGLAGTCLSHVNGRHVKRDKWKHTMSLKACSQNWQLSLLSICHRPNPVIWLNPKSRTGKVHSASHEENYVICQRAGHREGLGVEPTIQSSELSDIKDGIQVGGQP